MEGHANETKTSRKFLEEINVIETRKQIRERIKNEMAKSEVIENDDLDTDGEDEDEVEEAEDNDEDETETPSARKRGRPKGSGFKKTTQFHAIVLTKRGTPKRIIVTHVMGKNVRAVSANNPDMDPVRLLISNVRHFDSDTFDQLKERSAKIDGAIDQNFGLFNQLKPLNAPKRIAQKSSDPADDL